MGIRSMTSNFPSTISKNLHSSTALTCNIIFRREESKFLDNCDVALHNKWKKYFSFKKLDIKESMTFDAVTCQNDAFSSQNISDPRILAMSYTMYKIGKFSYFHMIDVSKEDKIQ